MQVLKWQNLPATTLIDDSAIQSAWDQLNAQRGDLPFMTSASWIAAVSTFGKGRERLLICQLGDVCVAMLILSYVGKLRWRTFQPSQLPLGAMVVAPSLSLEEIAGSLLSQGSMKLSISLSLTQIDSFFASRFEDTARSRCDDYIQTAWIDIVGSFDDYWAARGKNLRQNMRKQRNKLQAELIAVEMRVLRRPEEMLGAIQRYGELEGKGWKAQEGTAIRADNDQGRFYTELLKDGAAKGEAEVYEYLFAGKTVAMNICLRRGTTFVILKTTYDESIQNYSPAFLLNQDLTQALFEEQKITRLEYYGGVMEWHTRWTDNSRSIYHLTHFRNAFFKNLAQRLSDRQIVRDELAPLLS